MIMDCSTALTEVLEQLGLLAARERRDAAQRLAQVVAVAQQEEQHHEEDDQVQHHSRHSREQDLHVMVGDFARPGEARGERGRLPSDLPQQVGQLRRSLRDHFAPEAVPFPRFEMRAQPVEECHRLLEDQGAIQEDGDEDDEHDPEHEQGRGQPVAATQAAAQRALQG
jgi:hypothetical protein